MKYVIEFGIRGGAHVDNIIVPTLALAIKLANSTQFILSAGNTDHSADKDYWKVGKSVPRKSWNSATHYVSLSCLDDVARGSASSVLWKVGE